MKKPLPVILLILLFCVAVGCRKKTTIVEPKQIQAQAEVEAQNKKIAYLEIEKLWNEGNLDVADQVYAPNQILHFRGKSYPFGPDEAKKVISTWLKAFPDFRYKIEDMVAEGDKVAVRYVFTGTHKGKYWGIAPTGKKINVSQMNIVCFENGKMVEAWEDYDEYGMKLQLGMELMLKEDKK